MMFLLEMAFALELVAMGVGVAILAWSYRNSGAGVGMTRFFGYFILIASIGGILCTSYYGASYWMKGAFRTPMSRMNMMNNDKMGRGMMDQGMIKPDRVHQKQSGE